MDILAASAGVSVWLYVLPSLTPASLLGVAAAFYPQWRQHKQNAEDRESQEARWSASADAVLGSRGDTNTGRLPTVGITAKMDDLVKTIGIMNGDGKSLMQIQRETRKLVDATKIAAEKTNSNLQIHVDEDTEQFEAIRREIINLKRPPNAT